MKDRVEFTWGPPGESAGRRAMAGYSDGAAPIDKAAQLVLSSDQNPISSIVISYVDGSGDIEATVIAIHKDNRTYDAEWQETGPFPPRRNKWADRA